MRGSKEKRRKKKKRKKEKGGGCPPFLLISQHRFTKGGRREREKRLDELAEPRCVPCASALPAPWLKKTKGKKGGEKKREGRQRQVASAFSSCYPLVCAHIHKRKGEKKEREREEEEKSGWPRDASYLSSPSREIGARGGKKKGGGEGRRNPDSSFSSSLVSFGRKRKGGEMRRAVGRRMAIHAGGFMITFAASGGGKEERRSSRGALSLREETTMEFKGFSSLDASSKRKGKRKPCREVSFSRTFTHGLSGRGGESWWLSFPLLSLPPSFFPSEGSSETSKEFLFFP